LVRRPQPHSRSISGSSRSNDTLKGQLDLERHDGRTTEGVYARIAQRLLALAACIGHSWAIGEPAKRSLTAHNN